MRGTIFSLWLVRAVFPAVGASQPAALSSFAKARQRMVDEQLSAPGRDIKNRLVLEAMATVPRHEFVPESLRKFAYRDEPLPIGYGQTFSEPFIVAFMTEQLNPKPTDRVLEIRTGSGYQAVSSLAGLSLKSTRSRLLNLSPKRAEADLETARICARPKCSPAIGTKGWPDGPPFDSAIVTCAPDDIPQPLIDQLQDGGRMIFRSVRRAISNFTCCGSGDRSSSKPCCR